jgi:hypothetical protein
MAIGTTAAILGAAAIGATGAVVASKTASKGTEGAAQTTAAAGQRAEETQERMLERQIGLQEPFRQAGLVGLPRLQQMITGEGGPIDIEASPLYQWQREQGEEAINRAAAARGGFGATSTVQRLGEFQRGLGAEETQRQYGRLLDLVNIGRGATTTAGAQIGQAGMGIAGAQERAGAGMAGLQQLGGQQRASMYAGMGALPLQTMAAFPNMFSSQAPTFNAPQSTVPGFYGPVQP